MNVYDCLQIIEQEYAVKILLAVESGSRAWGFESKNSDWDVRFIYIHRPEWYFKVDAQRDVIEKMSGDLDMVGWELRKALALLKRSNPSLFEWLNSPIVYYEDKEFVRRIQEVASDFFNPAVLMYHYLHIYKKHDERYLQKEDCSMKRFLYYLRGILACKWIEANKTVPPVPFDRLVSATVDDKEIRAKIDELIRLKKGGEEHDKNVIDGTLMQYARHWADYFTERADTFRPEQDDVSSKALDSILYDTVLG